MKKTTQITIKIENEDLKKIDEDIEKIKEEINPDMTRVSWIRNAIKQRLKPIESR